MAVPNAIPPASQCGTAVRPILISICIPTYNRAQYLGETLESLIPQVGAGVELIVYDTGSTDGTPQMMERYTQRLPSLRFFSWPIKLGFDETALRLVRECRGEYVWLFGSDDLLKPGAVEVVRRAIQESSIKPALIYLNHEVVDHEGRLLIASNIGRANDRRFLNGRSCVAWLGLHLGYISACLFRKPDLAGIKAAREFVGTLWMGLHFNLASVSNAAPALYLGRPFVISRRNPANTYSFAAIFVRNANFVFWAARRRGMPWWTIYRAMHVTVRVLYFRLSLGWRCDHPETFRATFPAMLRTCWMYPWFWALIAPLRVIPTGFTRAVRDRLRDRRGRRNQERTSAGRVAEELPAQLD